MDRFRRLAVALGLNAALFAIAGCAGQSAGGALPASSAHVSVAAAATALKPAKSGDLLYATIGNVTYVYTYPGLKPVETLKTGWLGFKGSSDPSNGEMCFDNYGSVVVYAHGGKTPIATIKPPSEMQSFDCAFDQTTHALAMTVDDTQSGTVQVYSSLSGQPVSYSDPNVKDYYYVAYDELGDLFVDGTTADGHWLLDELPKGASKFVELSVSGGPAGYQTLRWDGAYMTVRSFETIYRLDVSGSGATVIGTTKLSGARGYDEDTILNDVVLSDHPGGYHGGAPHDARLLGLWHYPKGGGAYDVIKIPRPTKKNRLGTVLISVAP